MRLEWRGAHSDTTAALLTHRNCHADSDVVSTSTNTNRLCHNIVTETRKQRAAA